jgi:hypothetical protein
MRRQGGGIINAKMSRWSNNRSIRGFLAENHGGAATRKATSGYVTIVVTHFGPDLICAGAVHMTPSKTFETLALEDRLVLHP